MAATAPAAVVLVVTLLAGCFGNGADCDGTWGDRSTIPGSNAWLLDMHDEQPRDVALAFTVLYGDRIVDPVSMFGAGDDWQGWGWNTTSGGSIGIVLDSTGSVVNIQYRHGAWTGKITTAEAILRPLHAWNLTAQPYDLTNGSYYVLQTTPIGMSHAGTISGLVSTRMPSLRLRALHEFANVAWMSPSDIDAAAKRHLECATGRAFEGFWREPTVEVIEGRLVMVAHGKMRAFGPDPVWTVTVDGETGRLLGIDRRVTIG